MRARGLPFTKKNLSRIAPELMAGPFDPTDAETINSLLGRAVKAKVTIRKYEGDDTNNVAGLYAGGGDDFV